MNLKDNLEDFFKNIGSLDPQLKNIEPSLKKIVSDNSGNPEFKKNVLKGLSKHKKSLGNQSEVMDKMIKKFLG